jgi:hypothetical protein
MNKQSKTDINSTKQTFCLNKLKANNLEITN